MFQLLKKNDIIYTPSYVVEKMLPLIPSHVKTIWEPASGKGHISKILALYGYNVIETDIVTGQDFMDYEPTEQYDMIITNPPFSDKTRFLKRAYSLGKPFLMLLPSFSLVGVERYQIFKTHGITIFVMRRRIRFLDENDNEKGLASFYCHLFGWHLTGYDTNKIYFLP